MKKSEENYVNIPQKFTEKLKIKSRKTFFLSAEKEKYLQRPNKTKYFKLDFIKKVSVLFIVT